MKSLFVATLAIASLGLVNSSHAITHLLSGPMDVFQATTNPENLGNGAGTISGDYDEDTNLLNYTLTWQDLIATVTNMHFHNGVPGVPGGIDLPIPGPWTSPYMGTETLTEQLHEDHLLGGTWYVNIHTDSSGGGFGGGEIRGQVVVTRIPEPAASGLAAVAILSIVSLVRRKS